MSVSPSFFGQEPGVLSSLPGIISRSRFLLDLRFLSSSFSSFVLLFALVATIALFVGRGVTFRGPSVLNPLCHPLVVGVLLDVLFVIRVLLPPRVTIASFIVVGFRLRGFAPAAFAVAVAFFSQTSSQLPAIASIVRLAFAPHPLYASGRLGGTRTGAQSRQKMWPSCLYCVDIYYASLHEVFELFLRAIDL
jgi:hypothetical protein